MKTELKNTEIGDITIQWEIKIVKNSIIVIPTAIFDTQNNNIIDRFHDIYMEWEISSSCPALEPKDVFWYKYDNTLLISFE